MVPVHSGRGDGERGGGGPGRVHLGGGRGGLHLLHRHLRPPGLPPLLPGPHPHTKVRHAVYFSSKERPCSGSMKCHGAAVCEL